MPRVVRRVLRLLAPKVPGALSTAATTAVKAKKTPPVAALAASSIQPPTQVLATQGSRQFQAASANTGQAKEVATQALVSSTPTTARPPQVPGFRITINDTTRDMSQGPYANRISLADRATLKIFELWNQLNSQGPATFGIIEMGGASVQVDTNFLGLDHTETARKVRAAAPDSTIRPLWRGANSWLLKPAHPDDLHHLLKQFALDVAPIGSTHPELLRVKAFDSQGIMAELASTAQIVEQLRQEGHPISLEVAIPYSNGEGRGTPNPYSDEFFVSKAVEAARMAQAQGIPPEAVRISLKDMVGELTQESAYRLVSKMMQALRREGFTPEIGVHCHDTGLALNAYRGAVAAAREEDWPINVDTVGGQGGRESGFVNTLDLVRALEQDGIHGLVSPEQVNVLKKIDGLQDQLRAAYQAARAPEVFSGEDCRYYGIPGGGQGSFIAAVNASGLGNKLVVPEKLSFQAGRNSRVAN